MKARQREPAVRLSWTRVFQEEHVDALRLLFGLTAQTAGAGLERLRVGKIALAGNDIGAGGKEDQRQQQSEMSHLGLLYGRRATNNAGPPH